MDFLFLLRLPGSYNINQVKLYLKNKQTHTKLEHICINLLNLVKPKCKMEKESFYGPENFILNIEL